MDEAKLNKSINMIFEMMAYRKYTHYFTQPDTIIASEYPTLNEFIDSAKEERYHSLDEFLNQSQTNIFTEEITNKTLLHKTLLFLKVKNGVDIDAKQTIFVIWFPIITIDIAIHIQYLISNYHFTKFIIIYSDKITTPVKNLTLKNVQFFELDELQYNPTNHKWVPKHIVCPKSELESVLKSYKIEKHNISKISINDPQIKWLGVPTGTLIRIIRELSETIPNIGDIKLPEITYRIVS